MDLRLSLLIEVGDGILLAEDVVHRAFGELATGKDTCLRADPHEEITPSGGDDRTSGVLVTDQSHESTRSTSGLHRLGLHQCDRPGGIDRLVGGDRCSSRDGNTQ